MTFKKEDIEVIKALISELDTEANKAWDKARNKEHRAWNKYAKLPLGDAGVETAKNAYDEAYAAESKAYRKYMAITKLDSFLNANLPEGV